MVAENMRTKDRLDNLLPEITEWRQDIHQHPELGYEVHRTAALVSEKLKAFGCDEVVEGIGKTGVVGVIHGRKVSSKKVVGLRADMDALPIVEATGAQWASKTEGQMHACGHDGHTAMLLGAARGLCDSRDFDGTVVVIFQPAEEGGGGGEAMVLDGMMDRFSIDEVYGMHNMPGLPIGEFALRPGPLMASADEFEITVEGQGGHAAMPHVCKDTLLAASHIVVAMQSIVARNIRPIYPAVVSVTAMQGDTEAFNVTPQFVTLRGTVRAFDEDVRKQLQTRVIEVAEATAAVYGATASVRYAVGYPPTVNNEEKAGFAADVARSVVGDSKVDEDRPPMMGAEDFSYMLNERPGAFIFIGNGDSANLHHPKYDFDDQAIRFGCQYWMELVDKAMPLNS